VTSHHSFGDAAFSAPRWLHLGALLAFLLSEVWRNEENLMSPLMAAKMIVDEFVFQEPAESRRVRAVVAESIALCAKLLAYHCELICHTAVAVQQ
jgi:hypothetical protein